MGHFHFIYGSAGSGKSASIYKTLTKRAIEEPEKSFYLFVPEQNTLKAQQELIRYSEVHGILNLDVLSLSQLSYRVMEELGIPCPEILDEISKSLLMRKALSRVKKDLTVYHSRTEAPGFIRELGSVLTEFAQYHVTEEDLRKASETAGTELLRGKCADLAEILGSFYALLSADGGKRAIPEELPELLLKNIDRSRLLRKACLYFDGYTGFTPIQLEIIGRMAEQCESLSFAVTIPGGELFRTNGHYTDLFWLSRETVRRVSDICTLSGLRHAEDEGPAEEPVSLWKGNLSIRSGISVSTFLADDPTEEIRFLVQDIAGRAMKTGLRYRKTAVAVADLGRYREIVRREFSEAGIPFFIDDKAPAAGSPVVELLRSLILMIRNGYDYEDVITYLRNPYVTPESDTDTLDLFENFMRATGLKGKKRLGEGFSGLRFIPDGYLPHMEAMETYRKEHFDRVFSLHDSLRDAPSADEKALCVLSFLTDLFLSDEVLSEEERRFLRLSRELLERIISLFSGMKMGMKEFSELVEAGLGDMKAGVVPSTMDMVNIGDLRRSRFDDIDCLYIAGANEGLIPADTSGGGIFTDAERMELTEKNLELAPDDRHDASIQNFYLYLLMNKPSRQLTVTYAAFDREGKSLRPSVICKDLPAPRRCRIPAQGPEGTLRALAEKIAAPEDAPEGTVSALHRAIRDAGDAQTQEKEEKLLSAALRDRVLEKLSPETAHALYGTVLEGSVTRFEQYARCPFSHFLGYGLGLKEREKYEIEAYDIGRLYHRALDAVFTELGKEKKDLGNVSAEELSLVTGNIAAKVCAEYNGSVFGSSARNRYIAGRVQEITGKTLLVLKKQFENGTFLNAGTEKKFTVKDENFTLSGSIDRLDVLRADNKTYLKIIDYKSGTAQFDLGLCYEGLELQLSAYMREALSEYAEARPAGMFIYNIKDPVLKYGEPKNDAVFRMNGLFTDDAEVLLALDRSLSVDGASSEIIPAKNKDGKILEDAAGSSAIVPEETFRKVLERNRDLMRADADGILGGRIEAQPYLYDDRRGCDYCRYREVCGFDKKLGFSYRKVPKHSKKEITELLENGNV